MPSSSQSVINQLSSRLVIFVGPSGSGKDTLMVKVRDQILAEDLDIHIVQRWITRAHDETEGFRSITKKEFYRCRSQNLFALSWEIYDNCYGVPWDEINPFLEKGIVLLNLSRAELERVKTIYPKCKIVLVEVSKDLASDRIKQRKRDQGKMLDARLKRLQEKINLPFIPDLILKNNSRAINSVIVILKEFIKACLY